MAQYTDADALITGKGGNSASHSAPVKTALLRVLNRGVKDSELTLANLTLILAELAKGTNSSKN